MSLRAALGRLWCWLWHPQPHCGLCNPPLPLPAPLALPEGFLFDWMRDSAPLWEPGSTAFWLEPETPQELANWHARYRPEVTGVVEAAGLRIEIVPAPAPVPSNPYANRLQHAHANQLQSLQRAQQQNMLTGQYNSDAMYDGDLLRYLRRIK